MLYLWEASLAEFLLYINTVTLLLAIHEYSYTSLGIASSRLDILETACYDPALIGRSLIGHPVRLATSYVERQGNGLPVLAASGPCFPPRNDPATRSLYCASMLMLFEPWRSLLELKGESLDVAFTEYLGVCSKRERDIMDNIQWYYETADAVAEDRKRDAGQSMAAEFDDGMDDDPEEEIWGDRAGAAPEGEEEAIASDELAIRHRCSLREWQNREVT